MRMFSAVLVFVASLALGDVVVKNAGARLGPVVVLDCAADGGITCTRPTATSTAKLYCAAASATEQGCVSTAAQSFTGEKTFYTLYDGGVGLLVTGDGIWTPTVWGWNQPLDLVGTGIDAVTAVRIASNESWSGMDQRIASFGTSYGNDGSSYVEKVGINPVGTISTVGYVSGELGLTSGAGDGNGTAFASFAACASPLYGRMLYDSTNHVWRFCNAGTGSWAVLNEQYAVSAFLPVLSAANGIYLQKQMIGSAAVAKRLSTTVMEAGTGAGTWTTEVYLANDAGVLCTSSAISCAAAAGTMTGTTCSALVYGNDNVALRANTASCSSGPAANVTVLLTGG